MSIFVIDVARRIRFNYFGQYESNLQLAVENESLVSLRDALSESPNN